MLFEFYLSAGRFELGFDFFSFFFRSAFLNGFGSAFNEVLSVFEPKSGNTANFLDHIDLLGSSFGQHYVELCLFISRFTCGFVICSVKNLKRSM